MLILVLFVSLSFSLSPWLLLPICHPLCLVVFVLFKRSLLPVVLVSLAAVACEPMPVAPSVLKVYAFLILVECVGWGLICLSDLFSYPGFFVFEIFWLLCLTLWKNE